MALLSISSVCITSAHAHPISISDAYVLVEDQELEVRIEVYVEDLYLFQELELNDENQLPNNSIREAQKKHAEFLQERFSILNESGQKLDLKLVEIDDQDVPDFDIPYEQLMFFKLTYRFKATFETPPTHLTFLHQFQSERSTLPAEVQVKLKPAVGRRIQVVILPGQPWTVSLLELAQEKSTENEEGPNPERSRLGIQSYGETYAFLYNEPDQIRFEVLIPFATLAGSLDVDLKLDAMLGVEQQDELKPKIWELIQQHVSLLRGDKPQEWQLDRIDFFGVSIRDFARQRVEEKVGIANARVGIMMSTKTKEIESTAKLKWSLFNEFLYQLQLVVLSPQQTERLTLRQIDSENEYSFEPTANEDTGNPSPLVVAAPIADRLSQSSDWQSTILLSLGLTSVLAALIFGYLFKISVAQVHSESESLKPQTHVQGWISAILGIAGLACLGIGMQQREAAARELQEQLETVSWNSIVTPSLQSIYSALNEVDEASAYDRLSAVCTDELSRKLYLELSQSFRIEAESGEMAHAGQVTVEETDLNNLVVESPQVQTVIDCHWEVPMRVEHWGHVHEQTNQYAAELSYKIEQQEPKDEMEAKTIWKLVSVDLKQVDHSKIETSVREF